MSRLISLVFLIIFTNIAYAVESLKIVTTIKPLHGIISGVTKEVIEPEMLLQKFDSPHHYNLKPSDVKKIARADLIFIVHKEFETFLKPVIENVKKPNTKLIQLGNIEGITLLKNRDNYLLKEEDHHHNHDHDHGNTDYHIWLDPNNTIIMVEKIRDILMDLDPSNALKYSENSKIFIQDIINLDAFIASEFANIEKKPYIVYHDAYQYFEKKYGLHSLGYISVSHEPALSAKKLIKIRKVIYNNNINCLFVEPGFPKNLATLITQDTNLKTITLDPEWGESYANVNDYISLMHDITYNINTCLN